MFSFTVVLLLQRFNFVLKLADPGGAWRILATGCSVSPTAVLLGSAKGLDFAGELSRQLPAVGRLNGPLFSFPLHQLAHSPQLFLTLLKIGTALKTNWKCRKTEKRTRRDVSASHSRCWRADRSPRSRSVWARSRVHSSLVSSTSRSTAWSL